MSCGKTAELIDLPFGLWTRVGLRKHKFSCIRQVARMCSHALWHHLANTIELSVCCGDAALCQITLTTCYLRQGGYVFVGVCLFVCLLVSNCAQKRPNGFT